jgi:nucleotide-binding universal stress UspA family protein
LIQIKTRAVHEPNLFIEHARSQARKEGIMYRRILVPVDGSATSGAGVKEALKLAKQQHAKLRLLHVVDEFHVFSTPDGGLNAGAVVDSLKRGGRRLLERTERLAASQGVKPESAMVENLSGRVADIVVQQARRWRADLIVMGTHGRRGMNRALLGSDAELVVRQAPVPVLLVRSNGKRRRARAGGST